MDPLLELFHSFLLFYADFAVNCRTTDRRLLPFEKEEAVKEVARGIFLFWLLLTLICTSAPAR